MTDRTQAKITAKIAHQLYLIFESMGADSDLLSIIGSYGDTIDDEEILQLLEDYVENGELKLEPLQ